jgi:putative inorganic carbon (HCO3(-)) transporter
MDVYAWTVLVISVMIYALIKSKKSAASILGVFAIILFVLYLVSDILPNYFMMLTGDSLSGNIEVMHVSAKMAGKYLLTGIGLGETVFENIYKSLSQTGSVSASNGGNLLFEMLIRFGIVGILFLVSVIVLVYRQAFSTYKVAAVRRFASVYSVAALTAFTALIMVSGMNYIWKDFYMAYMFWTLIGLVSASRSIAAFDNATLMKGDGLDIKLPISTFRKKVKNR